MSCQKCGNTDTYCECAEVARELDAITAERDALGVFAVGTRHALMAHVVATR